MSTDDLTILTLTPDNPSNCTITDSLGVAVYSVITEHTKKATITQVRNADDEIIAYSEWRDVLPDKVTIGDKKPMSLGDWMKKSMIPFKEYVYPISQVEDLLKLRAAISPLSTILVGSTSGRGTRQDGPSRYDFCRERWRAWLSRFCSCTLQMTAIRL